ncbi:MAG: hypothetical protein R3A51_07070 [Nannocystaceae bacterium]|nr:hypothetical protein [Myxococcales bacterium]
MTGKLTEEELREAAAEAGISPEELRRALAGDQGNLPARVRTPGDTGVSVYKAESNLLLPPEQATDAVRRSIERLVGTRGHRQGAGRADIVDDARGLTYRIHSEADGQGGALVRVDVDPSAGAGGMMLSALMFGGFELGILALAIVIGSTLMFGLGVGIGIVGALTLVNRSRRHKLGRKDGQAIVAQALLEAEEATPIEAPVAYPPVGRELPPG